MHGAKEFGEDAGILGRYSDLGMHVRNADGQRKDFGEDARILGKMLGFGDGGHRGLGSEQRFWEVAEI